MGYEEETTKQVHNCDVGEGDDPDMDTLVEVKTKPMEMVQLMLENGVTEVPPRYIQPPELRMSGTPNDNSVQIPVIDMSRMEDEEGKKQVHAELSRAFQEWGFVQVINHGVPSSLMDAQMNILKQFFALPAEEKEQYKLKKLVGSGYGRLLDMDESATADWSDHLYLTSYGDQWKKTMPFPKLTNPSGFQEIIDEYGEAVHQLIKKVLSILSEEVGQPPDFFMKKIGGEEKYGLRAAINYYPPCPDPDLVMGLSPHTDAGGVLVALQQEDVVGLDVMKDGAWVSVHPIPHALVINVGDMLQMVSNGKFRSVVHRAHCTEVHPGRFSIATFSYPALDAIVEPAPELCSESKPQVYKSVKYYDFLSKCSQVKISEVADFKKQFEL